MTEDPVRVWDLTQPVWGAAKILPLYLAPAAVWLLAADCGRGSDSAGVQAPSSES